MSGAREMRATQVLHCNLNVVDIEAAATFYEHALGLSVLMRSESTDGDSTALGVDGPTHSIAWFLYDHRGGRAGPAVELVEWRRPPTAGSAYDDPTAIGLQALRFAVPSAEGAATALVDAGATRTDRVANADDGTTDDGTTDDGSTIDAELCDLDGVRIELAESPAATAPTFSGVRLSCSDVETSTGWYGALGWERVGPTARLRWSDREVGATVQRLALATHPFELHLTGWADAGGRAHLHGNDRGLFRMALAVDDVRAACAQAARDGIIDVGEPEYVPLPGTPLGGLWVSFFRDPDGVMVELVERATGAV
jgi:catechol 2,3-dioxygenase-like lactoylglutathione lyase family enzyme